MKEKIKQITNTNQFHISMVALIVVAIIFVAGVTALKYNVEGESKPPFNISKMSVISNVDGTDVEDTENKIETMKEKIPEIKDIKLIKENEDGTKEYVLESDKDVDLRKIVFNEFAKENITIFEMKKADTTLEDAFMKLIEGGEK